MFVRISGATALKQEMGLPYFTLDDIADKEKVILMRVDLNVPMKDGHVADSTRIVRHLPTVRELVGRKARLVLLSHFGRPEGKVVPHMSLQKVVPDLMKHWQLPVAFAEDCIGPVAERAVAQLQPGQILLLENTRFHAGEEKDDPAFAAELAKLGDVFVNDAFSVSHRANATTTGLTKFLPSYAGRLMQSELEALGRALEHAKKPVAALVGGSKISTKLDVLNHLIGKVDILALGGAMANTFLAARGIEVGKSMCERDMLDTARAIDAAAKAKGCEILLPMDGVVAPALKVGAETFNVPIDEVPADCMVLDTGAQSVQRLKEKLSACHTVLWNGPLGVFEVPPFDHGTNEVAQHVAMLTKQHKLVSVAGGGDTAAALANAGCADEFSYISTAGGAFLEWIEGKELPAIVPLRKDRR